MKIRFFSRSPALRARQRGAHAAAFAVTVVSLFFAAGLGIDAGRMFVVKSEIQHAADACALAAASGLTGSPGSLQEAEDFGFVAGLANLVDFQTKNLTSAFIRDSTVTFSDSLNGVYQSKSGANYQTAAYVRCTIDSPGVSFFLFPVVNAVAPGTVGLKVIGATAIATLDPSITACIMPMGICANDTSDTANFGFTVGEWLCGRRDPNGGSTCDTVHANDQSNEWSGSFRWLKLPGYESVPEIRDLIYGTGQCAVTENLTEVDAKTGVINGVKDAWNSRFGTYDGNFQGIPDASGVGYTDADVNGAGVDPTWGNGALWASGDTPPGSDAFADFLSQRLTHENWSGYWASPDVTLSTLSSAELAAQGGDRRVLPFPIIGCPGSGTGSNRSYDLYGYACMLMLHPMKSPTYGMKVEYLGNASDPGNPCAANGLPGGANGPNVPGLVY